MIGLGGDDVVREGWLERGTLADLIAPPTEVTWCRVFATRSTSGI